jgi:poly(beta-D-mannuronate) lyase
MIRPMSRRALVMFLLALDACGSSHPPGPSGPSPGTGGSGETGNTGGSPGTGGTSPKPDAATGTGGTSMTGGSSGTGGSGGVPVVPPDAAAGGGGGAGGMIGSDPTCTRTTPVADSAQLGAKLSAAVAGDCLVLADGNYTIPSISLTGTEAAPIVIRAANRGKAVVNAGAIHFLKAAYVTVEGMDITTPGAATTMYNAGSNGMVVSFMNSHHCRLSRSRVHPTGHPAERDWIVVVGAESHHNRIDHNDLGPVNANANMVEIDGTGMESPLTAGNVSQYNQIDHNHFHEVNNSGGNNWETLRIGRSWQGPTKGFNVIEHNLLVKTTGDPETISLKSSDNIVRYNTMLNVNGEITSRHGNRNQIYGNYIIGGARGMRIYGADHRIYNNYVAASSTGIWIESGAAAAMDEPGAEHYRVYRAWVFNNTVIGQPIKLGGSKAFQPLDCRVANNLVVGAGIDNGGSGTISEGNITGMNPLTMQDGVQRLLANAAGAAAIGKAVNTDFYMLKDDIQGQPRMEPDVGADEASMAPVTIKGPLTPADVGPDAP